MMIEVQAHGFEFQYWVRDTFFSDYSNGYGDAWDIPAKFNRHAAIPAAFSGLPVSIKTAKFGSPIGLGDAVLRRGINAPFVMIVGFWTQRTAAQKWFEDIVAVRFSAAEWNRLWGTLTATDIADIDAAVKDMELHYSNARKIAKEWKQRVAKKSTSKIVINPKIDSKIDSKKQRRIQCSLPFRVLWECAGRSPNVQNSPTLFEQRFPNPIQSSPRTFNRR